MSTRYISSGANARTVLQTVYSGAAISLDKSFFGISAWYAPWNSQYSSLPSTDDYSLNRYCFVNSAPNIQTSWGMINHTDGVYDWAAMDTWTAYHNARGTELLYSLGAPCPLWATPAAANVFTETSVTPNRQWCKEYPSMAVFAAWVLAVGLRYQGKIKYWFVANEPDLTNGEYLGTVPEHAQMTRIAYQILKNIDPNNKIIGPEISNISSLRTIGSGHLPTFLNADASGYDAGFGTGAGTTGKDWLDYISFHPYTSGYSSPLDPYINVYPGPDGVSNYTRLRNQLTSMGISKPLWASELMMMTAGPTSVNPTWTWEKEYSFLFRSAVIAAVSGVSKFTWFSTGGSNKPYLRSDIPEGIQAKNVIHQLMVILGSGIISVDVMNDYSLRVVCSLGTLYL